MRYLNGLLVSCIFLGIPQSCFAQILSWNDNIPSALQPFQNNPQTLASYTQNNIFIFGHPVTKTAVPTLKTNPQPSVSFNSAAIIVPVNAQQVAKTLTATVRQYCADEISGINSNPHSCIEFQ